MRRTRIIRIWDQKIYLNPELFFSIAQTNLAVGGVRFGRNHDIYWEIEFDESSFIANTLTVKVSNYHPRDTRSFYTQPVKESLQQLYFKGIYWDELQQHLISYQPNPVFKHGVVIDSPTKETRASKPTPDNYSAYTKTNFFEREKAPITVTPGKPETTIHKDNFDIYYDETQFEDNHIRFSFQFHWHRNPIEFTIDNHWLKKEYDYIKYYFAKVLGNKQTFNVSVAVTITDGTVTDTQASSAEINRINANIIDSVKYHRVLNLIKTPSSRKKKSLSTTDDIFENFEEGDAGNVFGQAGPELLNYIIDNRKVRNEQQLKFLANDLHLPEHKLRFTLSPLFGFVFYLPGRSTLL